MASIPQKQNRSEANKSATGARSRAQFRWAQIPLVTEPTLAWLGPECKVELLPKEIDTQTAAEVLSCSVRTVQEMCNGGLLVEGRDWRKIHDRGGRGKYQIAQRAILELLKG